MREMLFRGKREDTGEWVYGYITCLSDMKKECIKQDGYYISNEKGQQPVHLVERNTVGQYTGLTDKNGVKIFEGDIVELNYAGVGKINSIISWVEGEGAFTAASIKSFPCIFVRLGELPKDVKIAGNLHDNPEMLMEGE
jgi:uncharacterized phage protein (TIGR01671 family)